MAINASAPDSEMEAFLDACLWQQLHCDGVAAKAAAREAGIPIHHVVIGSSDSELPPITGRSSRRPL